MLPACHLQQTNIFGVKLKNFFSDLYSKLHIYVLYLVLCDKNYMESKNRKFFKLGKSKSTFPKIR